MMATIFLINDFFSEVFIFGTPKLGFSDQVTYERKKIVGGRD